jgi:phosphatidylglycerol lysyltransferase
MQYPACGQIMLRRYLSALVPFGLFCAALIALHRLGGEFHLNDVLAEFHAIAGWRVLVAIALTAGSYLALVGYERLALGYVGRSLPWTTYALTSFVAYAVGHSVGVAALSGGAIRYRIYSPLGFGAAEIARVVAFCTLTFALGASTLAGVSLIANAGEASSLLHSTARLSTALGVLAIAAVAGYLLTCSLRRAPFEWRGASIRLPALGTALAQIALAAADLSLASAALYVLLPATANVSYLAFAGLYMVALAASLLSLVPGGLGVFESIMVLLLPGVPAPQMLGALIAYRLVYYALPFGVALILMSAREFRQQRARLTAALTWTQRSLDFAVPQAIALLVFAAGFLLLLSGATPGVTSRLAALDRFLPLPVVEISHLVGSATGVLLLILARGLMRRLDGAWQVTMSLLGAGMLASLLKGLDYEEALLLGAAMLPLWWTRKQFYRKSSLLAEPMSPAWLASAGIAIGASIWVGMLAYRHVPYSNELWWQFELDGQASRMLRASLLAVLLLGAVAVFRLLAPARSTPTRSSTADLDRALPVIRHSADTSANLALLGDKSLLFSDSGQSFLMYGVAHRSWVAMGDPVGCAEEREDLIWTFRDLADRVGAWGVFYQVSPDNLPLYVDAGLALSKLGEEARVRLEAFSLEGSSRATLRYAHKRAQRDGLAFRVAGVDEVPALLPRLRQISDEWLQTRSVAEKGFSLGCFSEPYLCRFRMAVVEYSGQVIAFADLWEGSAREELSADLMRHSSGAPGSVMDFLFIELMLWGRAQGYRWFNLGMAPLAGLEPHRLAPAWHKVGRLIYRYGEHFYNFEGLRQYKEKFLPEWRPRYLAAPGGLAQPRVLLDVTSLISGGLMDAVRRRQGAGRQGSCPTSVPAP